MLIHIFTLIRNNLRSNLLLMAGLFIISTALWYAVDYVYAVVVNQQKPLGFDWEHVYYVQVGVLPEESEERDNTRNSRDDAVADYLEFYNRLSRHAAVESVCYTYMHFHYVWKNSFTTLQRDTLKAGAFLRYVSPGYFSVFRVKGFNGTSPDEISRAAQDGGAVLTENAARRLLTPDDDVTKVRPRDIVGKTIDAGDNDTLQVVSVCADQKYNEYGSHRPALYYIIRLGLNDDWKIGYGAIPAVDMFVRVKAEADRSGFTEAFRKEMRRQLRVGNLYLADMRPMSQYRETHLSDFRSDLYTYLSVAGFFLINAFLAVLGTFWFRTQQRREELAVRLVAGATPRSLMGLLMGEGALLVTMAYVPALIVAFNLGHADLVQTWPVEWSGIRFLSGGLITYALLLAITAFSIWFPARQAMKIQPAEALHGE